MPTPRRSRIVHCVPALHVGGVNRALLWSLEALGAGPNEHVLCVLSDTLTMAPEFEAHGIEVVSLGHTGKATTLRTIRRMRSLLRERQADVVHTHLLLPRVLGGIAARTSRIPHVATVHSTQTREFLNPDASAARTRFVLSSQALADELLVTRFVAVSEAAAAVLLELRPGAGDRIVIIHNGIDLTEFDAPEPAVLADLRSSLGIGDGDRVVLSVGRMVPAKNQLVLPHVMASLLATHPEARLLIVGRGAIYDEVDQAVRDADLGDRIELIGLRTDVPALLHLAEVVLQPSTHEGFGILLVEAMAARTPVVAADIPAFRELVEPGVHALLVAPDDAPGLAAAVADVLDHPDAAAARSAAGRTLVEERFTSAATARRLDELYASLTD